MSRPCCSRCGTIFSTTNGKREKSVPFAASAGLSFPGIYVPTTMTSEGAKKKRPAPTATAEGTCPLVVNIGNAPTPKFTASASSFQEDMLEFDGLAGV